MEKSSLKSRIIMELKEKIQSGDNNALNIFLKDINGNAPLIEEIEGDLDNSLVTFIYQGDENTENIVFMPPNGMENLLQNKMERLLDTNLWYISYKVNNNIKAMYFFSVNDSLDIKCKKRWEALCNDKLNKNNITFKGNEDEEDRINSYVVMPNAKEDFWTKEREDICKGTINEHEFYSDNLYGNRKIRVYTPYGYKKDGIGYKFLVLTDGDEYINILSTKQVLDNLIAEKKIPPLVAIFIDSTSKRYEELTCNDKFCDSIVNEIIPWVRESYNISKKADDAIIGGLSLGGLSATYLGLKHSETFGNVISQSGSFWYSPKASESRDLDCWIKDEFNLIDKLPLKFHFSVGVLENKDGMIGTNLLLKDVLLKKGYNLEFEYFNSGHDYLSWGEMLANGLISVIGLK